MRLWGGILNVGTMRGRSGEVVETLTRRCNDLCCIQEVRMLTGKDNIYKFFHVGNSAGTGGVGF